MEAEFLFNLFDIQKVTLPVVDSYLQVWGKKIKENKKLFGLYVFQFWTRFFQNVFSLWFGGIENSSDNILTCSRFCWKVRRRSREKVRRSSFAPRSAWRATSLRSTRLEPASSASGMSSPASKTLRCLARSHVSSFFFLFFREIIQPRDMVTIPAENNTVMHFCGQFCLTVFRHKRKQVDKVPEKLPDKRQERKPEKPPEKPAENQVLCSVCKAPDKVRKQLLVPWYS